jgi:2-aminoadipate transaminase
MKLLLCGSANVKPVTMKESGSESTLPFSRMGREIGAPVIVDLMNRALRQPGLLSLAAGFTDNAALPLDRVGAIVAELTAAGADPAPLQYGTNQGRPRLRELTAARLGGQPGECAAAFSPEACFLTNGSQQALYLAVQVLCDPGDIVLVEEPSYFVCLEMLKGLGVRAVGIPCDEEGAIEPEAFRARLRDLDTRGERSRVKAVYLVSYFSNPSSRSMALEEKRAVARILSEASYRIPVIEDGAYRDLYFEAAHPVPSVISMPEFEGFPRLYLGTYTKPFATGLKVGFGYCTDPVWMERMLCVKGHQDFGSAHFNQCVVERLLESGGYAPHLAGIRPHYAAKAAAMEAVLRDSGLAEAGWRWLRPQGGLLFWLRGPEGIDTRMGGAFCQACIETGVLYVPGDLCFPEGGPHHCVRLSFGAIHAEKLEEAVTRFAREALRWSDSVTDG